MNIFVDEERKHVLTNFNALKRRGKALESDHNTTIIECMCTFGRNKPDRRELFNFKNEECQK